MWKFSKEVGSVLVSGGFAVDCAWEPTVIITQGSHSSGVGQKIVGKQEFCFSVGESLCYGSFKINFIRQISSLRKTNNYKCQILLR